MPPSTLQIQKWTLQGYVCGKKRNGAFVQFQGVNGQFFSKEGVKNISSMFKLSGSQSVTLEQKQSQAKREKSKSTPGQGGLMHTNGFCHLWLGKIYDSAPQSPNSILCTTNIKLNGEKLKAIYLRSDTRQKCWFLPLQLSIVLEVLVRATMQEK